MRCVMRRAFGALILAALTVVAVTGAAALAGSSGNGGGGLSKHDRELLAQAKAAGKQDVVLIIASKGGANRDVVKAIEAQGGSILNKDDSLGYVLARVATDKVQAVAAISGIQGLDLDEVIPLDDPRPAGQVTPTPQTPPSAATLRSNPYMPVQDTNSDDFTAANPTWDGRGVTIGIIDTGIDLDHPSLNITSTGEAKIIDWVTGTLPDELSGDPTWLDMSNQVNVAGGSFTVGTTTYTGVAADGTYRFAVFNERDPRLGGELGSDVNRDGNPAGSNGTFGVLWRTSDNMVFVDDNADRSFAGEPAMTDFKVNRDKGYFGTDNLATAVKEAIPFVVQTDGKNKRVNIGIVSGAHGSHVAGIAAGNSLFGGAMSGQAPGAKIVSLRACLFITGCTAAALTDGMVYVAKQSNVDVINMSIGGLPSLNDGNNARALLYTRLIEQENVQLFLSAGNSGSGVNTVGDPAVADKVMALGSYISKETWQKNYGSDSQFADNLHGFSSRGPREDGGFAPQLVAPGSAISTVPTWQLGQPVGGTYVLPPGYGMFNGTSMASPQAAGSAALLISAAKQAGVQSQPDQLREALKSSARYLDPRILAHEQGVGIIDVPAAWNLLKTNLKTDAITSSVPVNTLLSGFLATPGVGTGIYDREGVTVGQSYTRTYTFTRTSGGGGSVSYNLSWLGNDGTFSSPATISLAKNAPTQLVVTINPTSSGIHSAVLRLDDPSRLGIEYETSNVVIAADQFTAGNNFSVTKSGTISRNQTQSFFFNVPAATPAFKVDFSGPDATPGTGQARFLRFHPYGVGIDANTSTNCYSPPVPGGGCPGGGPNSRTASNPQAGVWEVTIEGRRTSDVAVIPFTLTASILGATVTPNPDLIASATIGVPIARSYTLTNTLGSFVGRAVGTSFGSARLGSFSIAHLAQQQYPTVVTAGSTSLRATIGSPSDPAADLDLFVFNCTTGPCVLAGQSADGDSEESVTIANPAAGNWLILVDGFNVPAGTTTYNYVDVFTNAAFGAVSVTDANALRPSGASWTVPGSVTANSAPASGRVLLGNVQVRTDSNVLVGSGDVIVQSVTP
jgi:subtilisin family serine protease